MTDTEETHFLQPKITGYRQLTDREVALMNEIKAQGVEIEALAGKVQEYLAEYRLSLADVNSVIKAQNAAEWQRFCDATPDCWVSIARTDFQTALMALTRAVAQPSSF